MKTKKWLRLAILIFVIGIINFTIASHSFYVLTKGKNHSSIVYFGITKDFPPYSWKDQDGTLKGFYIDVYQYIKEQLSQKGYEVRSQYATWPELYSMLQQDKIQAIIGMSITPERRKIFIFSTPLHILVYKMYTVKHKYIDNLEDLRNPVAPLTVAVLKNSSAESYLKEHYTSLFLKEYPTVEDGIYALLNGEVDLLMGYQYVVDFYLQHSFKEKKESIYMLPIDFPGGHKWHAIAINPNHTQLAYAIDDIIKHLSENGVLSKLNHKWFGNSQEQISQKKLAYYIAFAMVGIILVSIIYHLQLASMSRKLKTLNIEKEDQKNQLEYQMNELMAAREELTAMSEQLMAQQEELTYLYENERTLKNQLAKLNDFLATLLEFFRVPEEGSDFTSQLSSFLKKTKEAFDAAGVYLYKYVPETGFLSLIAYSGYPTPESHISPGLVQSFLLGKTTYLPASADPFASTLKVEDGYIVAIPLVALKENKGVLILYFPHDLPENKKNNVISILENLSPSLAIYIENMIVIDAHLKEIAKLRELLEFIEKAISFSDIQKLLKEYTLFAKKIAEVDGAILLDNNGKILANTTNTNQTKDQLKLNTLMNKLDKEGWITLDDQENKQMFVIHIKVVDNSYHLVLLAYKRHLLPEYTKSISYMLQLVTKFVSIYATNIANNIKLKELLKLRAKESTLLRSIVDYLLKTDTENNNIVTNLAEIIEKSGIPVKVIYDGNIVFGENNFQEKDQITIKLNEQTYQLILGEKLPEYLKNTIQMLVLIKDERRRWTQTIENARAEWIGIIDSSPYPLVAIDNSGKIKKVNKAFAKLVNLPIETLIGADINSLLPGIMNACEQEKYNGWNCYEWLIDDIPIGKILIKGEY